MLKAFKGDVIVMIDNSPYHGDIFTLLEDNHEGPVKVEDLDGEIEYLFLHRPNHGEHYAKIIRVMPRLQTELWSYV